MKNVSIIVLIFLLTLSCGGTNNITEVGNPVSTKNAATASATTKALTQGTTGFLTSPNLSYVTIQTENFDCELTILSRTLTCQCPVGGSFTRTYDSVISFGDSSLTLDRAFSTEFEDCMITTCDQTVTLSGSTTGSMLGSYNTDTATGDLTAESTTTEDCSGMLSGDIDYGFDKTLTYDGSDVEFAGSYCYDGDALTFTSIQDLQDALDPDGDCDDFGP